ncbi:SDR family NAD(P)-dependent oxidoreductase [Methylomonas methanica]|uniref:Short-chain dehydrogenase/reductase SDR n=1 Tax=Methylomonas methanica (strain DSM 25384 / MC09) TaxID=857087 RepID=G0A4M4_METMM|nr:SDR family NAD(P)-dependent oxidoreductase [Methylomonas methanica]AEG01615.1 short-chain dehydrogenase/reductase SDR [Methylomonas methanica MC09]
MARPKAALVLGVGPVSGLGSALAKRFATAGLQVFIAGRSPSKLALVAQAITGQGGAATPVIADATLETDVVRLLATVAEAGFDLEIAAYNVDSNIPAPLLETDLETFTKLWQQNSLGAFLFGREAIKHMLPRQRGTLIFTGATASLRAKPPFTAFAAAKAGVRALAQGMAREFGPQGIHVVHAVIDGVIDGDRARNQFPKFVEAKGQDGLLQASAIAETYWQLHCQHPSAWTHEIDLRPFKEAF